MRVICAASNLTATYRPCGVYTVRGETEDYAVEILPPYNKDLGITSYVHPVGQVCPDPQGKIRIVVMNYGGETQTFSASNAATLTATVTGPVPGTYTTTLDAGTLAPGESRTLVIDNVDISTPGSYQINAQLTYAGDMYAANDAMSNTATVVSMASTATGYEAIPYNQDFDFNNNDDPNWLPTFWTKENSNANYTWRVYAGTSPNSGSNAGPNTDHTYYPSNSGHFAAVANANVTTYQNHYTALTSGCINLHYQNGYPAEVNFYDYFLGASNADFDLIVEAGSGSYYMPVDTFHKADASQLDNTFPWEKLTATLNGYDEVGRLRFKVTNHHHRLDVCIDDINVQAGLPDLQVVAVSYPYDFRDSIEHPNSCLIIGDSVHVKALIKNNGSSAFTNFDLVAMMNVGMHHDTIIEHVNDVLQPGQVMEYEFTHGFLVTDLVNHLQFSVRGLIDLDRNEQNNIKTITTCTNNGLPDDYEMGNGMVLYQNVPNPALTTTRISYLLGEEGKTTLKIFSTAGQLIYSDTQDAVFGDNHYDVDVAHLAAGVYYYTVSSNKATLTKKMVIQK